MKIFYLFFIALLPVISADNVAFFNVTPGETLTHGSCSGPLDYFLCTCTNDINSTVTFNLSEGIHSFSYGSPCILRNIVNFSLIGAGKNTSIDCNGFSVVFFRAQNITISNLKMVRCGQFANREVNETLIELVTYSYFVNNTRIAWVFFSSINVEFSNVIMQKSLGYSLVFFNAFGITNLTELQIEDTPYDSDSTCDNFDYRDRNADYLCTGSAIVYFFVDDPSNFTYTGENLMIVDKCIFNNNEVFYPQTALDVHSKARTTGYLTDLLPVIAEGVVAIYYAQSSYNITTRVSNTMFANNNSTISAGMSVYSVSTIMANTTFYNCTFEDNFLVNVSENSDVRAVGGIGFYYIVLAGSTHLRPFDERGSDIILQTISNCVFNRLNGVYGAALHIEKVTPDDLTISIKIEDCVFTNNVANRGSALYAIETTFSTLSFSDGGLSIFLTNVSAENNTLLPGSTLEFSANNALAGVFFFVNCQSTLICKQHCNFINNQPSVLYGYALVLRISGTATFYNNSARFGGAVSIFSSVLYFEVGSHIYFGHNTAVERGGALHIDMAGTNVQPQNICPIQFIGAGIFPIFQIENVSSLLGKFNITFDHNTVDDGEHVQSISSNLFYVCSWFPETLVLFQFDLQAPFVNDTRLSVYHSMFNYLPGYPFEHVYVLAYIPCLCDENGNFNVTQCAINKVVAMPGSVIPGRTFNLSIVMIDEVGMVALSTVLFSEVYYNNIADQKLLLDSSQYRREFSVVNRSCTPVEFRVYYAESFSQLPRGTITLSADRPSVLNIPFDFTSCPVGFELSTSGNGKGCVCNSFFLYHVENVFHCDSNTGRIRRLRSRAWLSAIGTELFYAESCLPTYCNDVVQVFSLMDPDVLCANNHAGRACGACMNGFSQVFGTENCERCSNAWLATTLLYVILGVLLVVILIALRFTVTMGIINGLIFFCNAMGINEQLFFNTEISKFSFIRVYISVINLDLGFSMCFYDGMSQLVKAGLQFTFPVYLWLLMLVIVYASKLSVRTNVHTVAVFATLLYISYSKLLRAVISVFSTVKLSSSTDGTIIAWQPDPTVTYLTGGHIVLFIIALLFSIFYIIPFAFGLTFPNRLMRYRRLNYFYPLVDCFAAPYKDNYRYWFGVRAVLLIYLSATEALIVSNTEALLLSSILAVGLFAFIQAYILPFKTMLSNVLDLMFMAIFLILSTATLYLYPSTEGYSQVNIAVNVLGYISFCLFCFVVIYHLYDRIVKHTQFGQRLHHRFAERNTDNWINLNSRFIKTFLISDQGKTVEKQRRVSENNSIGKNEDAEFCDLRESFLQ